jgi:hypothetical protein
MAAHGARNHARKLAKRYAQADLPILVALGLVSTVACTSPHPPAGVVDAKAPAPVTSRERADITPTLAPSGPSALPGACVPIPTQAWRFDRTKTQSSPPDPSDPFQSHDAVSMSPHRSVDVDGDGELDVLAPEPAQGDCNHDVHFAIYVVRGECGHRAGVVIGQIDATLLDGARPAGALRDLTTRVESGYQDDPRVTAQLRTITRTYRFNGAEYREISRDESYAVCHHCGNVQCTSSVMP